MLPKDMLDPGLNPEPGNPNRYESGSGWGCAVVFLLALCVVLVLIFWR
jgi:hypothetical protein